MLVIVRRTVNSESQTNFKSLFCLYIFKEQHIEREEVSVPYLHNSKKNLMND